MKVSSSNKNETQEVNNVELQKGDEEILATCDVPFKEMLNFPFNTTTGLSDNLISSVGTMGFNIDKDIKSAFNYDTFTIDKDDAKFFIDMVQNGQFALNVQGDMNASLLQLDKAAEITTYKSANVSKALMTMVDDAFKTQKPVRLDFDNNVSVILRVDKNGKVSAEFIPGDKAVENYLRNNIPFLKQRFDEQELSYNDLSYRQHKQQDKRKNKGE